MTGPEFISSNFQLATEDEVKMTVFAHHHTFYFSIKVEIKHFLRDNWSKWEMERPEWYNARVIALVPAEYLPTNILVDLGGAKGRRASLDRLIAAEDLKKLVIANSRKPTVVTKKKFSLNKAKVVPV